MENIEREKGKYSFIFNKKEFQAILTNCKKKLGINHSKELSPEEELLLRGEIFKALDEKIINKLFSNRVISEEEKKYLLNSALPVIKGPEFLDKVSKYYRKRAIDVFFSNGAKREAGPNRHKISKKKP